MDCLTHINRQINEALYSTVRDTVIREQCGFERGRGEQNRKRYARGPINTLEP